MRIIIDEQQYQELEDLVDIFDGMFFDNEEVQCFRLIKEIVDNKFDTNNIERERKKIMEKQLRESIEWLKCLNVNIKNEDKFLSCFCIEGENSSGFAERYS